MFGEIQYIESLQKFEEIINGDKPVIIDFTATWCGPCHMIAPIFAGIAQQNPSVGFYKVDVDAQAEIAQKCSVRSMPTFLSFHKGEKLDSFSGANPGKLEELVNNVAKLAA